MRQGLCQRRCCWRYYKQNLLEQLVLKYNGQIGSSSERTLIETYRAVSLVLAVSPINSFSILYPRWDRAGLSLRRTTGARLSTERQKDSHQTPNFTGQEIRANLTEEKQQTYSIPFRPSDIQRWDGWQGDGGQDIDNQGTEKEQDSRDAECTGHGQQEEFRTTTDVWIFIQEIS